MTNPLGRLLARLEGGPVVLTANDRREWHEDWNRWLALGWIVEITAGSTIECPECDESHAAMVRPFATADGPVRWFSHCPMVGAVRVDPEELRQWAVNVAVLGRVLSDRDAEERVPGVVWRLGPISVDGRDRLGWMVTSWRGRTDLAKSVPELVAANALVFVPNHLPPPAVWGDPAPSLVVPLTEVLTTTGTGLMVRRAALASYLPANTKVAKLDARPQLSLPVGTTWTDITLVVADHHVELVLGTDRCRVGYAELGLADQRNGRPTAVWGALVHLAGSGELSDRDGVHTKSGTLKNNVNKLRAALKDWTGLSGDPFLAVRRGEPYRPRFQIRIATPSNRGQIGHK